MTRAFAFSLFAGLLGATLGACADPDTLPGADAAPEDAGMLDAEPPTDLWAEGSLRLTVDPEGVQATLWWGDHAALTPWTVGFEAAGDRWTTADWPERTWTTGPDWAEGRYTGAPTLPVLVWRITREADAVRSVVRLEAAGRRAVVDRLITLSANVASPRALGAQGWLPVAEAPPRRGFQRLQGGAVSLAIHSPGTWISVASGLEISPRSPTTLLGPGDSLSAPAVTVRLDGLWAAWPGAEVPVPAFGWRSGAWGSALSGSLVRRQGQALAAQGLASDGSLLLLEGLWYAGPGDWRPGLVFPGGFEGIRAAV
ncbi:MAG: hypothetical protein KC613_28260, partial [Myxococcales bacterium]|nr:hypothetical protein [Myxococcales bacterium]